MHATDHPASHFRINGLPADSFRHLFGLPDDALAEHRARRYVADAKPGFPDRIGLRDADVGESVILVNYAHLPDAGIYRSSHAVYVIEGATTTYDAVDRVPECLRPRPLSLRGFDRDHMMVAADLVDGSDVESLIARLFLDPAVAFIHAHYARRGCYACRIDRVPARDAH